MHEYNVEHSKEIKDLRCHDFHIISSTDHHFAIADTFKKCLRETRNRLLISAPYVSKSFFDRMRDFVPKEVAIIKFLTKLPDKKDGRCIATCRAIESFIEANSLGLERKVMCRPYLHPKFIIPNKEIVLFGSVNPTPSGIYDNDELAYLLCNPTPACVHIKRHIDIFHKLWNDSMNTPWEKVQLYYGYKGQGDRFSTHKKIAEAIQGFFHWNRNKQTHEEVLARKMIDKGFDRKDVVEVINNLGLDGVLFRPEPSYIKLVRYQADIHDF